MGEQRVVVIAAKYRKLIADHALQVSCLVYFSAVIHLSYEGSFQYSKNYHFQSIVHGMIGHLGPHAVLLVAQEPKQEVAGYLFMKKMVGLHVLVIALRPHK